MLDYEELDSRRAKGKFKDWRKYLSTQSPYRAGNTVRIQPRSIVVVCTIGVLFILMFYYLVLSPKSRNCDIADRKTYNSTYPLSRPINAGSVTTYKIAIIADIDTNSKSNKPGLWYSYLKKGILSYNPSKGIINIDWDKSDPIELKCGYSFKDRGMELSELVVFDGKLLTFDDRSGMVFEIIENKVIPWVVLADGNGKEEKGFKSEWATVKNKKLIVGSMGKEWTSPEGQFENYNPMWIKTVTMHGEVEHVDWSSQYKAIRGSIGIKWPGYMLHESGAWSDHNQQWVFLPRRCSTLPYNEKRDEEMGCNYLITADENFENLNSRQIMKPSPTHGFSSFKFLPGTEDNVIVALRTLELNGETRTYILAFTIQGQIIMPETLVANIKYEGFEFI